MMNDRPPPPDEPDPIVPRDLKAKRTVPSPRKAATIRSAKGSIFGKASIPSVYWAGDDPTPMNNEEFTFYREDTPPLPGSAGNDKAARTRGFRQSAFDHDEEDSDRKRKRMCCGMKMWVFWLLFALIIAVVLGVGIGVGVGIGANQKSDQSAATTSGDDGAIDMSNTQASTMGDCMEICAKSAQCTGVSWGNVMINGAAELRCWLKRDLKKSHSAVENWNFAVLL
ncbi:hypothetical protein CSAL01_12236 [Colletotrichum salicis]|uniref:Apple domain-containing protein n=1 Tax=Colletotrichum salicis TaxID=1209931 RepID=A0A135UM15_9PEZI|nr:hypothetical protein CSAL01_12236 [Colletotrichum salicis]